jgi:molecular chaperone HtpG
MAKKKQSGTETGTISIHTDNIFPIIKKWLYSDKEIFLRELVSNAVDAIHKLQHINLVEGLKLDQEFVVDVEIDKEAGTLTIRDNGIGMTADEVRRYINQIAFSSAEEFIEKYKKDDEKNQIIGHFGLGFYSAFMVAEKVEIRTLSWQEGAKGADWSCAGSTSYSLAESDRSSRGTEIVLHMMADEQEFLDPVRVRQVLVKYCNFLPVSIRLNGDVVNDRDPLWTRSPSEVSDEDYKAFYHKLYPMADEPLFWIHLNIDFPFNLKGIVYFPRLNTEFDVTKSHIKLFCNQVFVSDNCKELIPEFLTPLQGCLDAPDLPLNVSRSYLQNEPQVRKINEVLTSRVAGRLVDMAKKDRDAFVKIWSDISPFVKFGMLRDDKFYDKTKDHILFTTTDSSKQTTIAEYLDRAKGRHDNTVYYATDETAQSTYLKMYAAQKDEVLILDHPIDAHLLSFLEMKNSEVHFQRVDADLTQNILESDKSPELATDASGKSNEDNLRELFKEALPDSHITVRVESLRDESIPGVILQDEQSRRFRDMTRMYGDTADKLPEEKTLVINLASPVIRNLSSLLATDRKDDAALIAAQVHDLAQLAQHGFDRSKMEAFLERSNRILSMIGRG